MVASTEVLDAYRNLWKEKDESKRRDLAEKCLADNVDYYAQDVACRGRNEFLTYVAGHQESANERTFKENAEQHNGQAMLQWEQPEPDGSGTLNGVDYAQVDTHGLLNRISSFRLAPVKNKGIVQDLYTWAKNNPIQALALAGGTLYILLKLPLSVFYERLGVTPEDVGFSNVTILLQSFSVYVVAILIGISVYSIVILSNLFPSQVAVQVEKTLHPGIKPKSRWLPFHAPPLLLLWVFLLLLVLGFFKDFRVFVAVLVLYWVWPYAALLFLYRKQYATLRGAVPLQIKVYLRLFLKILPTYALLALLVAIGTAYSDAERVREGDTLAGEDIPRPWRAPAVHAFWVDTVAGREELPACEDLRYLGSTDKSVMLFDSSDDDIYRVQLDKVAISIKDSEIDCPG